VSARDIDDIFGECLRREQRLLVDPWEKCDCQQQYKDRSHQLRLMLRACGLELTRITDLERPKITHDPVFWRGQHVKQPEKTTLIRHDGGPRYSVLVEENKAQQLQTSFTVDTQLLFADRILRRDPTVMEDLKKPGTLSALAAYAETLRLHPVGVEIEMKPEEAPAPKKGRRK